MSWFSSKKDEPMNSTPTSNTPTTGPGAEQERYASHFSIGKDDLESIKDAAIRAAKTKGEGAEQDRYAAHFSPDHEVVKKAMHSLLNAKAAGSHPTFWTSRWGLGHDGWTRAQMLAGGQAAGAEQVRSHTL
jgi:hypothetical protein